jgi:DNA-binding HxlR family transcriptional regulator
MTATTATILRYLATTDSVSGLDFNAIAAINGIAAIDVSQTFGELIAAGLVRRDESRMIHNLATYRLTDAGHDAIDEMRAAARAARAAKIAAQEKAEREAAANWTGPFCPLCALAGNNSCTCR